MRPVEYTEDGIEWHGQTIGESQGRVCFGKDANGQLWVEVVCDNDGILTRQAACFPDADPIIQYLGEWFSVFIPYPDEDY